MYYTITVSAENDIGIGENVSLQGIHVNIQFKFINCSFLLVYVHKAKTKINMIQQMITSTNNYVLLLVTTQLSDSVSSTIYFTQTSSIVIDTPTNNPLSNTVFNTALQCSSDTTVSIGKIIL